MEFVGGIRGGGRGVSASREEARGDVVVGL